MHIITINETYSSRMHIGGNACVINRFPWYNFALNDIKSDWWLIIPVPLDAREDISLNGC